MKIRNGFVSNSSSSSFCVFSGTIFMVYGTFVDLGTVDDVEVKLDWESDFKGSRLEWFDMDEKKQFIGRNWTTIQDDETALQFKEKTQEFLEKLIGHKVTCSTTVIGEY